MRLPYLVTGAAGFIGARFVESCRSRGIGVVPVISVDQDAHFRDRGEHSGIDMGKIVDRDALFAWLDGLENPRTELGAIIHLGACSRTTETNAEFLKRNNVEYSQKLWDFCTKHRIPFVYASSAATYGEGEHGYSDDEARMPLLKPLNLYGQSKQTFDLWALEQEKHGHQPPAWSGFKFFNVYGFGETHKGSQASVVLHAFNQIRAQGKVKLFKSHRDGIGDGEQKRDFIAVEDVVEVLHFALEHPIRRGVYNLGTGQARTFLDLVRAVFKSMGSPEKIEFIDTPIEIRDKYQYFTQAEMQKLRAQGYTRPFLSLEDGIAAYIRRLKKNGS